MLKTLENHHIVEDYMSYTKQIFEDRNKIAIIPAKEDEYNLQQTAREKLTYYLNGKVSLEEVSQAFSELLS